MKYHTILLLLLLIPVYLVAQNPARTGKDYAYLFYVTKFQDKGWPALPETKKEMEAIATELKENYGFRTELMANPTKAVIEKKIASVNSFNYGPDDQVLFFFSTHGYYEPEQDEGFLIPRDGKLVDQYGDSWVNYASLGRRITLNGSGHVLLSLDACYFGAFGIRNQKKGRPGDTPWEAPVLEDDCALMVKRALKHKSRIYFSSGSKEQRTPAHSLFAHR